MIFPLILFSFRCLNSIYFKYKGSTELDYFPYKYITLYISKNGKKIILNRFFFSHLDFENYNFTFEKTEKKYQRVDHLFFITPFLPSIHLCRYHFLDIIGKRKFHLNSFVDYIISFVPQRSFNNVVRAL